MNHIVILGIVLGISTIFGLWYRSSRGTVKPHSSTQLTESDLNSPLGKRFTLVQFSTDFCSFCRPTRKLLEEISQAVNDVKYIDLNAESKINLVKRANILSTPTTLILDAQGYEIGRVIGVPKREQIVDAISPMDI